MNITIVSPTGTKINKMPVTMLPQTTAFLANNKFIQDYELKDKLNALDDFMLNFDILDFYKNLDSNPVTFINDMFKKEAYLDNVETLDLLMHVLETAPQKPKALEKLTEIREEMSGKPSTKKAKKAKNEQRPTLKFKPGSGDDEEDPKKKHKFESPKLRMM